MPDIQFVRGANIKQAPRPVVAPLDVLFRLSNSELKEIAEAVGLDSKTLRNKQQLVEAILEARAGLAADNGAKLEEEEAETEDEGVEA